MDIGKMRRNKMERTIEKGNTLIVSGPASVTLIEGKITILGSTMVLYKKVIIRKGKTLPLEVEKNSRLDVKISSKAYTDEITGSIIPDSWRTITEEVLKKQKPSTILILGNIDCGKSTLCTFFANHALRMQFKTVIIDADIEQADIGPPATIGLGLVQRPVSDLFYLKAYEAYFTGNTNPKTVTESVIEGITLLKKRAEEMESQVIIINTDGWIQGEDAKEFKTSMIRRLLPNTVIGLQNNNDLENILKPIEEEGFNVYRLNPFQLTKNISREIRKELREQSYKKYLRGNILRNLQMNWIQLERIPLCKGTSLNENRLKDLEKKIECKIVYCEETPEKLFIVLKEENQINNKKIIEIEELLTKKVHTINDGMEKGLLVSLLDQNHHFLGLGVISKIDYKNKKLKLFTPCRKKISIVQFGQIKSNRDGKEL
jgi:polynucleotide 5'-hydroxyl-kinase GRC3/NOL9